MLVIVENRNIAAFLQPLFDLEAAGCGDILQIYAAEAAGQQTNGVDDLVHILGANAERDGIHIAETLEEGTLAFHNRHACFRTDVAQTQNSGAVCDNSHQIAAAGQVIALGNILLNFQTGLCNTRGIRQRKVICGFQRCTEGYLDFSLPFIVQFQRFCCIIHSFPFLSNQPSGWRCPVPDSGFEF